MPDWNHVGWWRHPSHERKIRQVEGSILAKVMARHRRRRMLDSAIVTTSSILLAAAVVFAVVFLVSAASSPSKTPVEYAPSERIRVVRIDQGGTCSR